jgi:transposase
MDGPAADIPDDLDALRAALVSARADLSVAFHSRDIAVAGLDVALAEAANAKAKRADDQALIHHMQLEIEKLKRRLYGQSSERVRQLLDQMELGLEEVEATATEDELAAERAAAKTTSVTAFTRKRPARKPFPEHIPRERILVPGPTQCACCGSERLRKLSEATTEILESVPRTWKVMQFVREAFSCRDCEAVSQAPAPFHVSARGWAGPSLLAMIAFEKFAQHQPLNRQVERYAKEGVPLSLSTVADQIGVVCDATAPLFDLIEAHVFAAARIHGDDTSVRVLAKGKCDLARVWDYIRDDKPFGGDEPPAAVFYYSRDREGIHPQAHMARYSGILQADAFGGYQKLYEPGRTPGPIIEAACWAHARRKFFELADIAASARRKAAGKEAKFISPMALEAVQRIDALFAIERDINGKSAEERKTVRQALSKPLVDSLKDWITQNRARLSRTSDVIGAMDYMLNRWPAFARFLDDGRICMSTDGVEKPKSIALGWFWGPFPPSGDHSLVRVFGALDVLGLLVSDFLDPVVSAGAGLSIGPRRSRLQSHLPQFHRRERRPGVEVISVGRQDVPDHHRQFPRRRYSCSRRSPFPLHPREERSKRSWSQLGRPGCFDKHSASIAVSLL